MQILSVKNYLKFSALVLLVFSIFLLFYPSLIAIIFSTEFGVTADMLTRFLGASLAGHAYTNWFVVGADAKGIQLVLIMNIIALAIATVTGHAYLLFVERSIIVILLTSMHAVFLSGFILALRTTHTHD